ncbi:HutD/Ves family protein [Pandoraea terrigena]|uniref:Protein Ves n=1 Tax=Pandoraea terrigena TaxID=2508292 RepID=A0A5E4YB73_9BURK|nr:HutD family protein [Pandoraea terrigena]VVE45934.1 Protein Ves [Pandoraea terrigena]
MIASHNVIALDRVSAEPWKNGGGVTRALAAHDGSPGQWRVSLAEITQDGPYSRFYGVVRHSLIVAGRGIVLRNGSDTVVLAPGVPTQYDGEPEWRASLINGACQALNVMVDRGVWRARVETLAPEIPAEFVPRIGGVLVVFSGDGKCEIRRAGERCVMPPRAFVTLDADASPFACTMTSSALEDAMPCAVVAIAPLV